MSETKDSLQDLERHRLQLEENVRRLQRALQHWQTWDAEYEALKEEVDATPDANETELARIRDGFEGELVNGSEIADIFGKQNLKSKDQIINVLDRRVDYVTKNIETLQKQILEAENKHAAAMVISQPDATDEEGQPITEIIEELDDDDNIISYRLNKPGESLSHVEKALQRVGIENLSDAEPQPTQQKSQPLAAKEQPASQPVSPEPSNRVKEIVSEAPITKGVSFSDDTKEEDGPKPRISRTAKRVEQIMKNAQEQENLSTQDAFIPEDEDPEDAKLRQQMLQYGMGEVGAVVAELELDEGDSDEDDYEFDYSDEGFEDDDEEDRYGRSTGRVVTDDYRQRMLELEKKLGIKSRFTDQQRDEAGELSDSDDGRIGRIVVNHSAGQPSSASKAAPSKSNVEEKEVNGAGTKKGVRFASGLDIASEAPAAPVTAPPEKPEPLVEPMSDIIVERSSLPKPPATEQESLPKKSSRFKKLRNNGTPNDGKIPQGPLDVPHKFLDQDRPTAPTGPEGTTLADTLVEHASVAAPAPSDDFDDNLIQAEVADEYQRMRKKFIYREGGFLKEDESPFQPLDESEGGPPRVSRFKAARLSKQ